MELDLECIETAADPGGGQGGHAPPPVPVKTSHKKMAAIGGPLYFMFLAPPLTILDPMLRNQLCIVHFEGIIYNAG